MTIIVLDTETTGLTAPEPIEMAYLTLTYPDLIVQDTYEERFNPSKDIELGAMATHNIVMSDLSQCAASVTCKLPSNITYVIGHNIDYDWETLGKPNVLRIDTLALSRYLFPDLTTHKQSAMLYYFMQDAARELLLNAHNALCDVNNCLLLLKYLITACNEKEIEIVTIEQLYSLSELARIPLKLTFGKHAGTLIKDIPFDYKQWLLRQPDIDAYLRKALKG